MPFVKGQSGNPKGRPKVVGDLRVKAREWTDEALATLIRVARDRKAPPAAQVAAASAILDRGYGKPVQATELSTSDGKPLIIEVITGVPKAPGA